MRPKSNLGWSSICAGLVLFVGLAAGSPPVLAQDVTVTEAIPNTATQGTISLDVTIKGSGYKKGARAQWFVTGTTNPGGVTVNSTAFVNPSTLVANITVAADAQTEYKFDIYVTSGGRTGKGIELFSVSSNGNQTGCKAPTPLLAAPINCYLSTGGCLDTTFGVNGVALTDTSGNVPQVPDADQAHDVVVQSTGKVVGVGMSGNLDTGMENDFTLVRYNPDGTLDPSFGTNGIAKLVLPKTQWPFAAAVLPDDKILVVGYTRLSDGTTAMLAARFNSNGTLDTTFGSGGTTVAQFVTVTTQGKKQYQSVVPAVGNDLALQSDGKIVVAASTGVFRLNPDGSLDSTFGDGGKVKLGSWTAVVIQPVQVGTTTEERILVGGVRESPGGTDDDWEITRLTPFGAVDASFGMQGDGSVTTNFCSANDVLKNLVLDSAGRIVAAGRAVFHSTIYIAIARYAPNGILDTSFGDPSSGSHQPGKMMAATIGVSENPEKVLLQPDGRIVLVGNAQDLSNYWHFALVRFDVDGALDTSFGTGGAVVTEFAHAGHKGTLQSDGKILLGGSVPANGGMNLAVARFWP